MKALFVVGETGLILLLMATQLAWIADFFWFFLGMHEGARAFLQVVIWMLVSVGAMLGAFGFLGYRRGYGSSMGLATFVISLIFCWPIVVPSLIYYLTYSSVWSFFSGFLSVFAFLGAILFGVMFILWGSAMCVVRQCTDSPGVAISAGLLFIVAGSFWCSLAGVLELVGLILLIPACILGVVSFATSAAQKPATPPPLPPPSS